MNDPADTLRASPVFRRIARYALRHKVRLVTGILTGVLAGGSVFPLLQMAPKVFEPFEAPAPQVVPGPAESEAPVAAPVKRDKYERLVVDWAAKLGVAVLDGQGRMTWMFVALTLALLPVVILFRALTTYVHRYTMRWVGARMIRDLRDDLFIRLESQSLRFFGKCDVGNLISRCTNDTTVVENVLSNAISDIILAPMVILTALVFVVFHSLQRGIGDLVFLVAVVFPICILPIVVLGRRVRRYMRRALEGVSTLVSRMHENFTGIRVVKAFHTEEQEIRRFVDSNRSYFRQVVKAIRSELLMTPVMEAVGLILGCVFFVVCFARGVRFSEIIPVGIAAVMVYKPLKELARVNANLQRAGAALDRIFSLLDTDTALRESPTALAVAEFRERVVFDSVRFRYEPEGRWTVDSLSFEIPRGHVVAVVGETGSGKTTLANLLARFYDPVEGRVLMDGRDLRDITIASLRRLIGVVTQDTVLFNDTIASNIAYGSPDATREEIEAAARKANAHEFIVADPLGYERVVGEKGFVLSGGEKQRVAIARAILKNPPILILDEATSALDTVTERLIQQAISQLMKGRTVFAIAHRLSTIRHANRILLLEKGRIVEQGSHEDLLQAGGRYCRLCEMQVLDNRTEV